MTKLERAMVVANNKGMNVVLQDGECYLEWEGMTIWKHKEPERLIDFMRNPLSVKCSKAARSFMLSQNSLLEE
jgi:hypothetical protein